MVSALVLPCSVPWLVCVRPAWLVLRLLRRRRRVQWHRRRRLRVRIRLTGMVHSRWPQPWLNGSVLRLSLFGPRLLAAGAQGVRGQWARRSGPGVGLRVRGVVGARVRSCRLLRPSRSAWLMSTRSSGSAATRRQMRCRPFRRLLP